MVTAGELAIGDRVFMGTRQLPLTRVSHSQERTELYGISFDLDQMVEADI